MKNKIITPKNNDRLHKIDSGSTPHCAQHSIITFNLYAIQTLKGQCHENFVLTETMRGFRQGPSDVPHPLLTSVPLICQDRLKMASIDVKQISSLCKTRMRVNISVYEKNANPCLRIYTERTQRFGCLYDMETGCVCIS